ncbi:unnamed protein product, partial [Discosporangium mesarthrocarpum]
PYLSLQQCDQDEDRRHLPRTTDCRRKGMGQGSSNHPIHSASRTGDVYTVRRYLDVPDRRDGAGMTCLHWAAQVGHLGIVEEAIGAGADIDAQDCNGWTPLMHACRRGHKKIVNTLIGAGSDVQIESHDGRTALHRAATWKRLQPLDQLIEAGGDVNHQAANKWTPLHCAAAAGDSSTCTILLQAGADPNVMDVYGHTPLDVVTGTEGMETLRHLLTKVGAFHRTNSMHSILNKDTKIPANVSSSTPRGVGSQQLMSLMPAPHTPPEPTPANESNPSSATRSGLLLRGQGYEGPPNTPSNTHSSSSILLSQNTGKSALSLAGDSQEPCIEKCSTNKTGGKGDRNHGIQLDKETESRGNVKMGRGNGAGNGREEGGKQDRKLGRTESCYLSKEGGPVDGRKSCARGGGACSIGVHGGHDSPSSSPQQCTKDHRELSPSPEISEQHAGRERGQKVRDRGIDKHRHSRHHRHKGRPRTIVPLA